jgi:hypothetical protein
MRHKGSTTLAFGATGYQAPELIGARRAADTNEEVLSNESYMDREIFCDKLTTKTDVYAYAMVALEVCLIIDLKCMDNVCGYCMPLGADHHWHYRLLAFNLAPPPFAVKLVISHISHCFRSSLRNLPSTTS